MDAVKRAVEMRSRRGDDPADRELVFRVIHTPAQQVARVVPFGAEDVELRVWHHCGIIVSRAQGRGDGGEWDGGRGDGSEWDGGWVAGWVDGWVGARVRWGAWARFIYPPGAIVSHDSS